MNYLVNLLVIVLCGSSSFLNVESISRIQGGMPAADNQFPYMISLQQLSQIGHYRRGHRCGGALVTLRHAVTSASCLYNNLNGVHTLIAASEYRVFAGGAVLTNDPSDRTRIVQSFTVHPSYNPANPHVNDIAVITLTTPFSNNIVSVVPLSLNDTSTPQGPICFTSGWGAQNETNNPSVQLMHLQNTVLTNDVCQAYFNIPGVVGELPSINIQDTMICGLATTPSSSCLGDSGNPLVCNGILNGILTINGHQCLNPLNLRAEVYTRVSRFAQWINATAGASTFQPGMAVLAVIAIVQIIAKNVFN